MDTVLRRGFVVLGRSGAVAAVMFGIVVGMGALVADYTRSATVIVAASSVLTIGGGVLYLLGLDRYGGIRGRRMRLRGWVMLTLGFLLPTSLLMLQLVAVVVTAPAGFSVTEGDAATA